MSWNEFLGALIMMNKERVHRAGDADGSRVGRPRVGRLVRAAGIGDRVILPCLLVYVLLQKYYVSGFLSGTVK
jgi:multiple sugar transport system permease protein